MKPKNTLHCFLLVASSSLLAVSSSHAADGTWNSDVTNSLWGTYTNWLSNTIADGSGSTAYFTNDITGDRTVTLDGDRTLTSVVFGDSDTATAGSWLLDNNANTNNNLILAGTTPGITVNALGTGKTATISAIIEGSAGLLKSGDGTLILSGANTYTGTTTVDGGTLALARPYPFFNIMGPLVVNANGTVRWDVIDGVADASTVTVNGGTLNLGSNSDYINTLSLNSGAQVQGDQSSTQYVIVNGSAGAKILGTGGGNAGTISSKIAIASTWGVATGNRTQEFDVESATTLAVSGPIVDTAFGSSSARVGSLLKSNSGTLTLSGTNTYTGDTLISGGTLKLDATGTINNTSGVSIGAGEFSYNSATALTQAVSFSGSSGTLSGTGTITPAVTVASNNTYTPGVKGAAGTQTLTGGVTFDSGSIFQWDIGTSGGSETGHDTVTNTGGLAGSAAVFNVVLGTGAYTDTFWDTAQSWSDVFSVGNLASVFSSITGTGVTWDSGTSRGNVTGEGYFTMATNTLSWTAVPEPTSALAGLLITAGLLRRRRAAGSC
jgi:autotransporter-associated beta strand protein